MLKVILHLRILNVCFKDFWYTKINTNQIWYDEFNLKAIQKRSHEPIYKTYTKNEAKGVRARKVGRAITKGGAKEFIYKSIS